MSLANSPKSEGNWEVGTIYYLVAITFTHHPPALFGSNLWLTPAIFKEAANSRYCSFTPASAPVHIPQVGGQGHRDRGADRDREPRGRSSYVLRE